jgi:hypothetical protein
MTMFQSTPPFHFLLEHRLLSVVTSFIFLSLLKYVVQTRYQKNLRKIPGPWIASVSNIYRLARVVMGHAHSHDIKLHRKYGDTVRIGPNAVSIGSATATKAIYGIGAGLRKVRNRPLLTKMSDNREDIYQFLVIHFQSKLTSS